ncbi:uncharacterized protein L203_105606 [Cryptococcus depauperatus CBS 7841]|uniref:Uncharacterized protein n=1 Tax=Cryptococcus depauperatus CBS 7841 TaxID=1295531 RepID=A0AAJ8M2N2_9TREE
MSLLSAHVPTSSGQELLGLTPVDKGIKDDAESATFGVYDLDSKDGKAKEVSANYNDAAGPAHDNAGDPWYVGGYKQAIISLGPKDRKDGKKDNGRGVVNGRLFNSVESTDKAKVAEAGKWGLKYLTGKDVIMEDAVKDEKDWDAWMEKAYPNPNPTTILTNDKPTAKGLEPNKYYAITFHVVKDNTFRERPKNEYPVFVSLEGLDQILIEVWELVYSWYKGGHQSFHGMVSRVKVSGLRRSSTERAGEMGEGVL